MSDVHRTVKHDLFIKSQLASRTQVQGLMWCTFGHVTHEIRSEMEALGLSDSGAADLVVERIWLSQLPLKPESKVHWVRWSDAFIISLLASRNQLQLKLEINFS